jgi:hypothetical protein
MNAHTPTTHLLMATMTARTDVEVSEVENEVGVGERGGTSGLPRGIPAASTVHCAVCIVGSCSIDVAGGGHLQCQTVQKPWPRPWRQCTLSSTSHTNMHAGCVSVGRTRLYDTVLWACPVF